MILPWTPVIFSWKYVQEGPSEVGGNYPVCDRVHLTFSQGISLAKLAFVMPKLGANCMSCVTG